MLKMSIIKKLYIYNTRGYSMITLTQHAKSERIAKHSEVKRPSEAAETAGSLAMLFHNGLMTIGQYDEFISSNPFMVDYSAYANCDNAVYSNFLSDFSNAVSTLGDGGGCGFSDSGFSGGGSCSSCGGFSSVC